MYYYGEKRVFQQTDSASLMAYVVMSNYMFSNRRPNKVPCHAFDARQNIGYRNIRTLFFFRYYCRDQNCWECKYKNYIENIQDTKRRLVYY